MCEREASEERRVSEADEAPLQERHELKKRDPSVCEAVLVTM